MKEMMTMIKRIKMLFEFKRYMRSDMGWIEFLRAKWDEEEWGKGLSTWKMTKLIIEDSTDQG